MGVSIASSVWKKAGSGYDTVSVRVFYLLLTLFVMYGLGLTAYLASQFPIQEFNGLTFIVLALVVPIGGIFIAHKSSFWLVSMLGYSMVVVPFGLILGPALNQYEPDLLYNVSLLTLAITVIMGSSGVLFPNVYRHLGGALFVSLLGLVLVRIIQLLVPGLRDLSIIDYIGAGIFSLYIGYDMYRASNVPKTVDNAVDIALALYLDILNLFLTLLRIARR